MTKGNNGDKNVAKMQNNKSPTLRERGGFWERFSEISRDRYFDISKLFSRKSGYRDIETDYRESGIILLPRSLRPQRWGRCWSRWLRCFRCFRCFRCLR